MTLTLESNYNLEYKLSIRRPLGSSMCRIRYYGKHMCRIENAVHLPSRLRTSPDYSVTSGFEGTSQP